MGALLPFADAALQLFSTLYAAPLLPFYLGLVLLTGVAHSLQVPGGWGMYHTLYSLLPHQGQVVGTGAFLAVLTHGAATLRLSVDEVLVSRRNAPLHLRYSLPLACLASLPLAFCPSRSPMYLLHLRRWHYRPKPASWRWCCFCAAPGRLLPIASRYACASLYIIFPLYLPAGDVTAATSWANLPLASTERRSNLHRSIYINL